ncbi:sulfurtransferase [Candidatus Woesearchaeota archaeon B3_Woes]|nr:MAG: sulfurtransferase [Candidatus Woesearchaeota archaeon B3_Woes]
MDNILIKKRKEMKNKNLFYYFTILVLFLVLVGAIFIKPIHTPYGETDVNGALILMENEDLFVINTHTPYIGEIDGTDLIAEDWDNMISYIDQLPKDKETPILVYCRSGRMAETSAEQLADLGYNNVYSLDGGMNAWQASGRNLVQK